MVSNQPPLLLLDTHVWIWLMNGDATKLSRTTRTMLEKAGREGGLRVSAISLWEVSMLEAKSRIRLALPCLDWINSALSAPGLVL